MGVDAEDCDGDGRPELLVTNFQNEHIAYYQNLSDSPAVEPTETFAGRLPRVVGRSWPGRRQQAVGRLGMSPPTSTTMAGPIASSRMATSTMTAKHRSDDDIRSRRYCTATSRREHPPAAGLIGGLSFRPETPALLCRQARRPRRRLRRSRQ